MAELLDHDPALDDHVNRIARLGAPVLISGIWYKTHEGDSRGGFPKGAYVIHHGKRVEVCHG